jgi:hypothetical protein
VVDFTRGGDGVPDVSHVAVTVPATPIAEMSNEERDRLCGAACGILHELLRVHEEGVRFVLVIQVGPEDVSTTGCLPAEEAVAVLRREADAIEQTLREQGEVT